MSVPAYDVNDLVRLGNQAGDNEDETTRAAFKDITGAATDPTTVTLTVRKPSGVSVVYGYPTGVGGNLTKEAAQTGRYYYDVSLDTPGLWHWELKGTGVVQTSESGAFYVRRSTV
jgi:hypothetical protein